jgi:hypothetical protein
VEASAERAHETQEWEAEFSLYRISLPRAKRQRNSERIAPHDGAGTRDNAPETVKKRKIEHVGRMKRECRGLVAGMNFDETRET